MIVSVQKPSYVQSDHFHLFFTCPVMYCALGRLHCALGESHCALGESHRALGTCQWALGIVLSRRVPLWSRKTPLCSGNMPLWHAMIPKEKNRNRKTKNAKNAFCHVCASSRRGLCFLENDAFCHACIFPQGPFFLRKWSFLWNCDFLNCKSPQQIFQNR